ncbi:DUF6427 family protein [Halpernia frigidisoli]|uniref:Uncharacterized protein n=1 Tax=Halpernia frigidisoli TaxID=1125876 RepID=A0A1I3J3R2_9FLAO|nr:DUF6427 family protein [Halpernia frigidisoli]SFI54887.1 hypothetical protein SAMN05443292_2917 [Halpernia frigidisoli]
MFRLLSKESNIFSIPVYLVFLTVIISAFNALNISNLNIISFLITFVGIALGYFVFNQIKLNYQEHLPLFLYTFFIFAFYPGDLDIGIAVSLFTNSFLLLFLTSTDDDVRKDSYVLIGALILLNFIFLPTTWPMILFVIMHVIATSKRIALDFFKVLMGGFLIVISYLGLMYFLGYTSWDNSYFPFGKFKINLDLYPLYLLSPIALMIVLSVMDHFNNFNKKSLSSRFKYGFILIFTLAQLITVILYMGKSNEYLLLLALPLSIILARYLKFLPKYWMRETGIWVIIFSIIIFKVGTYFKFF